MLTSKRTAELDHYFYRDHGARSRTYCITCGVGLLILIAGGENNWSQYVSFSLCVLSMSLVFVLRLTMYHSTSVNKGVASMPLKEEWNYRRRILVGLPLAAATLLLLAFVPGETEAEVMSKRIIRLLKNGEIDAAEDLGKTAVESGVALQVGAVRAITASQDAINDRPSTANFKARVQMERYESLTINYPAVYVPAGTYRMNFPLADPLSRSLIGDGREKSLYVFGGTGPLFWFPVEMTADVLVYNLGALNISNKPPQNMFIEVQSPNRQLAVIGVRVDNFQQVIDELFWTDVAFVNCHIVLRGGAIRLERVQFQNCRFDFSGVIGGSLQRMISEANGKNVTFFSESKLIGLGIERLDFRSTNSKNDTV